MPGQGSERRCPETVAQLRLPIRRISDTTCESHVLSIFILGIHPEPGESGLPGDEYCFWLRAGEGVQVQPSALLRKHLHCLARGSNGAAEATLFAHALLIHMLAPEAEVVGQTQGSRVSVGLERTSVERTRC